MSRINRDLPPEYAAKLRRIKRRPCKPVTLRDLGVDPSRMSEKDMKALAGDDPGKVIAKHAGKR